ncbi:MAG: hypothetical protein R3275_03240 [Saprospiraceae bacterium]|nr:hypothetical protein [Saprospiraceae bacterium]
MNSNTVFVTSEIRWFSSSDKILRSEFEACSEYGNIFDQSPRTDTYLDSKVKNTGIKFREGSFEIKVKSGPDRSWRYGQIERWIKWSIDENLDLMSEIDEKVSQDWIPVWKKRSMMVFEWVGDNELRSTKEESPRSGCTLEFTEIRLGTAQKTIYTLGLEAFHHDGLSGKILDDALKNLYVEWARLEDLPSYGYPEMLMKENKF